MKGDSERILAAGCDDYIAKPFRHAAFIAAVNKWLQSDCPPDDRAPHESVVESAGDRDQPLS